MKDRMKKALTGLGAVVFLVLAGLRVFGLEPQDQRPGLWLMGEVAEGSIRDWSFTESYGEIFLETKTRYFIPHSVTTYCVYLDGSLYIFSAYYEGGTFPDARSWNRNVIRDPRVRLKIGRQVFDQTLRHVTDESTRLAVYGQARQKYPTWAAPLPEDVHVMRVEPRG